MGFTRPCPDHDLLQLARLVGIPLSADEENVLRTLSRYIKDLGRYPLPKRADQIELTSWRAPEDDDVLERLQAALQKRCREQHHSRRAPCLRIVAGSVRDILTAGPPFHGCQPFS